MKNRLLAFFLILVMLFPLAGCGAEMQVTGQETGKNTSETKDAADTFQAPPIADKLSWEKINAFPIANSGMSIAELRRLCVDFFRFSKSVAWVLKKPYTYKIESNFKSVTLSADTVYGGFPYVWRGACSVYRMMDFYDPETGVYDIEGVDKDFIGNQCATGAFQGWGRVINSAKYSVVGEMTQRNGFIPIAPCTYPADVKNFMDYDADRGMIYDTLDICKENGEQTMYEAYAKLQPADGLDYYAKSVGAGHVIMVSEAATVVRRADGTIDPEQSYVTILEQGKTWKEMTQSDGSAIQIQSGLDKKSTFVSLFKTGYYPFTFGEFLGTDPVEDATLKLSVEGEELTPANAENAIIAANYVISDTYLSIKDENGKEVYSFVARQLNGGAKSIRLDKVLFAHILKKYADGKHTAEISSRLYNGELLSLPTYRLTNG